MNKPMTTLRQPRELVAEGLVSPNVLPELEKVASRYAVALTPHVVSLIDPTDPNDPIALQYVPTAKELESEPDERADPIGDAARSPVEGIVHRYPDRVLFKLVHVCAVYCRFCFRREMVGPGKDSALSAEVYANALDYIRAHSEIWEVILTGGDPLMLSPRRMAEVMRDLAAIPHVKIIRIHTRVPVADPARVSDEMVAALRVTGASTWMALHANHARELNDEARGACTARGCRHSDGQPIRVAAGRQRQSCCAGGADARLRRMPDQAILPASRRSGAGHAASSNDDR